MNHEKACGGETRGLGDMGLTNVGLWVVRFFIKLLWEPEKSAGQETEERYKIRVRLFE